MSRPIDDFSRRIRTAFIRERSDINCRSVIGSLRVVSLRAGHCFTATSSTVGIHASPPSSQSITAMSPSSILRTTPAIASS
jgi:hypothetical protein